jgi:uncharacterized membrane protein YphA (DoxX/SURF4 family)
MILLLIGYMCLAVAVTLAILATVVIIATWSVNQMDMTSKPLNDESTADQNTAQ